MCQPISRGGQRCASHTRQRLQKVTHRLNETQKNGTTEDHVEAHKVWVDAATKYASTKEGQQYFQSMVNSQNLSGSTETVAELNVVLRAGKVLQGTNEALRDALKAPSGKRLPAWKPPAGTDTPEGSFNQCYPTAVEYTKFLLSKGIEADLIQLHGTESTGREHPKWAEVNPKSWSHYVTRVGDICIDFTARQMDSDAGYPHIWKVTETTPDKWGDQVEVSGWNAGYTILRKHVK